MKKKLTPYEIMQKANRMVEENKKLDRAMDRILDKHDGWFFEHDEFVCMKCRTSWGDEHKLNLYLGMHQGQDAHKYECSNPECDHAEIILLKDMVVE